MAVSQTGFPIGSVVDVKQHGRATVIGELHADPASSLFGRQLVRYHEDDTTYHVGTSRLRLMHPTKQRILVARSTIQYRDAVIHNVDRPDVCLEIGCHEGVTTLICSNRTSFVVGVDLSADVVAKAQQRNPHLPFRQLDGLDVESTRALSPGGAFSRILIDISGKAPLELICEMIVRQRSAYPDAYLIVKNEALYDALAQYGSTGEPGRLTELLGQQHLAECEAFQHSFRTARTRPMTRPPRDK